MNLYGSSSQRSYLQVLGRIFIIYFTERVRLFKVPILSQLLKVYKVILNGLSIFYQPLLIRSSRHKPRNFNHRGNKSAKIKIIYLFHFSIISTSLRRNKMSDPNCLVHNPLVVIYLSILLSIYLIYICLLSLDVNCFNQMPQYLSIIQSRTMSIVCLSVCSEGSH